MPPPPQHSRQGKDPARNVRVSDELWRDVQWAVGVRGDSSVSHILRAFLERYVRETLRVHGDSRLQRSEPDEQHGTA